jgi:hypothetical protein
MTAVELPEYLDELELEALLTGAPGSRARPVPSAAPSDEKAVAGDSERSGWYHPAPLYNKQP